MRLLCGPGVKVGKIGEAQAAHLPGEGDAEGLGAEDKRLDKRSQRVSDG